MVHCVHFPALLPRNGILSRAKFTLHTSLAFSYIGSVHGTRAVGVRESLRHRTRNGITELSERAPPVFDWAAITMGIGPHFNSILKLPVNSFFLFIKACLPNAILRHISGKEAIKRVFEQCEIFACETW